MAVSIWVTNILGIIFAIIAAYVAISYILPMVRALVVGLVREDNRAVAGLMSLLIVAVYVLLFSKIVESIKAIDNLYLNYISVVDPGLGVLLGLLPYLMWVVLGSLIALGLKNLK